MKFDEKGKPKNPAAWRYGYYTLKDGNQLVHHGGYATREEGKKARKQQIKSVSRYRKGAGTTWTAACTPDTWLVLISLVAGSKQAA